MSCELSVSMAFLQNILLVYQALPKRSDVNDPAEISVRVPRPLDASLKFQPRFLVQKTRKKTQKGMTTVGFEPTLRRTRFLAGGFESHNQP